MNRSSRRILLVGVIATAALVVVATLLDTARYRARGVGPSTARPMPRARRWPSDPVSDCFSCGLSC